MLNKNFLMSMVQSYVNTNNELEQEDLLNLFGDLNEFEFDEALHILNEMGIHVVEEKTVETSISKVVNMTSIYEARRLTSLTNEQLCVMVQRGDKMAMDALVQKNTRLVYKIASKVYKEFRPESLDVEDLYIEGNMGLMKAAEKFEVEKGFCFTTYACWWIRQAITREAVNSGYIMRLPVHMFDQVVAVKRCRNRHNPDTLVELQTYLAEEGKEYTLEKLQNLVFLADKYLNTASMNDMIGNDESSDSERGDFIPATIDVEDEVMKNHFHKDIEELLESVLTTREYNVIKKRFGIDCLRAYTLEEIGADYEVTRERIRQIEKKAVKKLATSYKSKLLREYLCA